MTAAAKTNPAPTPSRREFLNYAFGASIALMLAGSCGSLVWFLQKSAPEILRDEAHGYFQLNLTNLPAAENPPIYLREQRSWLVNTTNGLLALFVVSPDDHCLLKWEESNHQFIDPCHGTRFQLDGTFIEGINIAPRNMDRFVLTVTTDHGTLNTPEDGSPVPIEGATAITLDTNHIIQGKARYASYNRGSLY